MYDVLYKNYRSAFKKFPYFPPIAANYAFFSKLTYGDAAKIDNNSTRQIHPEILEIVYDYQRNHWGNRILYCQSVNSISPSTRAVNASIAFRKFTLCSSGKSSNGARMCPPASPRISCPALKNAMFAPLCKISLI